MDTTGSRHTVTDWTLGLSAFAVFTVVALYGVLFTRPAGWNVAEWALFLLCVVGTIRIALTALKRRRQLR